MYVKKQINMYSGAFIFIRSFLFIGAFYIYYLYFGIGEQKQILIIENRFIVFQIFPI